TPAFALADGVVYAAPPCGPVTARRASDGAVLWDLPDSGEGCRTQLTATGERLYAIGPSGLRVFDLHARRLLWEQLNINIGQDGVVEVGGVAYFFSDGYLDAFRASDGHQLWRHRGDDYQEFHRPLVLRGVLFVATSPGHPFARPGW